MKHKLLVLGSDYGTLDLVKEAHKMGVYVVVSDTMDTSPSKQEADEAWFISTTDIDELEKKCKDEGINAVIFGASDFNINNGRKLCKRLGLPYYCKSDRAWEVACNKSEFKKLCKKVGAPVATDYYLTDALSREELDKIQYPVVVKPVDKSGNRGMSYCKNEDELIAAYKYARSVSDNETIIVERELHGPEFVVNYVLADGEIRLLCFSSEHNQPGELDNLYSIIYTTSSHLKQFIDDVSDKVKTVFREAQCREGIAWVETIRDNDGNFYLLEMGHRFAGEMTYVPWESVSGFNTIRWMLEIALGVKHKEKDMPEELNMCYKGCAASYFLFAKDNAEIAIMEGIEEIEAMPNTFIDFPKRVGNTVKYHASMGIIRIYGEDIEHLCNTIDRINSILKIKDTQGRDMFIYFDDYKTLREEYYQGLREFGLNLF